MLFVLEDDRLRRAPDAEHFRLALEFGRTLITLDYDFWDERRFPMASSPGVIVCSAPDEPALMRLLQYTRSIAASAARASPASASRPENRFHAGRLRRVMVPSASR